jgi:hypothetical protein
MEVDATIANDLAGLGTCLQARDCVELLMPRSLRVPGKRGGQAWLEMPRHGVNAQIASEPDET